MYYVKFDFIYWPPFVYKWTCIWICTVQDIVLICQVWQCTFRFHTPITAQDRSSAIVVSVVISIFLLSPISKQWLFPLSLSNIHPELIWNFTCFNVYKMYACMQIIIAMKMWRLMNYINCMKTVITHTVTMWIISLNNFNSNSSEL